MAEEGVAPHLAVRHHVEAGRLLVLHRRVHGPVLERLELGGPRLLAVEAGPRVLQLVRAQEAADDVAPDRAHARAPSSSALATIRRWIWLVPS